MISFNFQGYCSLGQHRILPGYGTGRYLPPIGRDGRIVIAEYIREAVKSGSGKIWFADTASHGLVNLVPAKRRHLKVAKHFPDQQALNTCIIDV